MIRKSLVIGAALAASAFANGAKADTNAVTWELTDAYGNPNPKVIVAGTGCVKDMDTFLSTNGNDLSVVFTNMGVNLPGYGPTPQLADRKSCTVRIPAAIAKGEYIGQLTQQFTYGVTKSAGSSGAVATYSTFFGFNVSPYTWSVSHGSTLNQPLLTQQRVDQFAVNTPWWQGWCNPNRSLQGFYQANLAVTGQRDSQAEDLLLWVDGIDLKYEVLTAWYTC